nr:unnamed protein product [Callosobruchus chinensis]
MSLSDSQSELPFITFPEFELKCLIDTGSTRSFITPTIAERFFRRSIVKDPFKISSAHGTSVEQYSITIPSSNIFNLRDVNLKFHLFKFHQHFDCLLGLDNLKLLNSSIDLHKNLLITPRVHIPLQYHKVNSTNISTNFINISPRSEQVIKIKVKNVDNGHAIIPYRKISCLEIAECLATVKNHEAICTILNSSENEINLDISDPIEVENFNEYVESEDIQNLNNLNFEKFKFDISKVRTDHMNHEEKLAITKLIKEYSDIFHIDGNYLTFTSKIKHHIRTSDEIPVYTKSYRYPEIYRKEVQKQIQQMLEQKIIRPSQSPWSSSLWVVPKKLDASGKRKYRLVVDYRRLNEKTIGDRYPLPNITDLLDKLGRCQYFSTLDLASGFHQIEMAEEDIPKTAFNTENGHMEWTRMPFGLKNAPATFQRVMDNILRGIQNEKCLVYLDDIIIFSTSLQEHITRLKEVFERLRQSNFKLQLDKSEFLKKEVAYLGHIVTPDGVKPNPDKIKAIQNFTIPKTTKQIKGFLGLLGYYRKFIKDFAKITKPLTSRLKKNAIINPNDPDYVKCFHYCKTLLTNDPILIYPDFSQPFNLTTDASNLAIGAVLSQGKIGSDRPIAYASRTLSESEINYSVIEKELLAIVYGVQYFRPYLFGRKFKIITDHKPLQWLFSIKDPHSKLMRWRLKLEQYDYEIVYKKGSLNKNADFLSRIEVNVHDTERQNAPSALLEYMENFNKNLEQECKDTSPSNLDIPGPSKPNPPNPTPMDSQSIQVEASDLDNVENAVEDSDQTIHSGIENPTVSIPIVDCPVNIGKNQIIISEVNFEPADPLITKLHSNKQRISVQLSKDNFQNDTIKLVKEFVAPNIKYHIYFEDPVYEKFSSIVQTFFKNSQIKLTKCTKKLIDVTDQDEIINIIKNYHLGKTNHRGLDETEKRIKPIYYWPNLRRSIQTYINNCEICLISKYDRNPLKPQFNITPTATKPFQILYIDSISLEGSKILTIVDSFSKYAQAYKLNSAQAIEVVNSFVKFFTHHCIPEQVYFDNGTEFKNSMIQELLQVHKINIHFTCSQHPNSVATVNRFHSTLIEHIRLMNNQQEFKNEPIDSKLDYAVLAYNNTIHSVTNLKPYEIITGHLDTQSPFDMTIDQILMNNYVSKHREKVKLLYKDLNEKLQKTKDKVIGKANELRENLPEVPEKVYVKNKQKQRKTLNKYKPEKIKKIDTKLKTAEIHPSHPNTTKNIHLSDIKRPRKNTYRFKNLPGPSSRSDKE